MKTFAGEERTTTTGTVAVDMTPSQWIEYRANQYRARGYVVDSDARIQAIIDFLDTHFKK